MTAAGRRSLIRWTNRLHLAADVLIAFGAAALIVLLTV